MASWPFGAAEAEAACVKVKLLKSTSVPWDCDDTGLHHFSTLAASCTPTAFGRVKKPSCSEIAVLCCIMVAVVSAISGGEGSRLFEQMCLSFLA
eukprot:163466-Pelagomonas_calceolata.AAC.8